MRDSGFYYIQEEVKTISDPIQVTSQEFVKLVDAYEISLRELAEIFGVPRESLALLYEGHRKRVRKFEALGKENVALVIGTYVDARSMRDEKIVRAVEGYEKKTKELKSWVNSQI